MQIEDPSYHDNVIHSVEFVDEAYETNLVLDIDYISEWLREGSQYKFRMSAAHLVFSEVSDLSIRIDKPGFTQNGYLDTILDIRQKENTGGRTVYSILLLSENSIEFVASGSSLSTYGPEVVSENQYLTKDQRAYRKSR